MADARPNTITMAVGVSVVVPCHNHGHLLGEALESVAAQDVADVEVLVVDDRSTDNTVAVAREHGARVVRSRVAGAAAARNAGVAASTGSVIGFLDADDVWPKTSLRLRLAALVGHDAAYGAVEEFVDPGFVAANSVPRSFGPTQMAGTMLVSRRAWSRVGPIRESLTAGEFIDWVSRFDDEGLRAAEIGEVVLLRRIHATNTTRGMGSHAISSYLEVARRHRHRWANAGA